MDDDAEVLDWGNEDDEAQVAVAYQESGQDDAEDAISLGGDEDDEIYPYKTLSHEDLSKAQQAFPRSSQTPQQGNSGKRDLQRENSDTLQKPLSQATDSSQLQRSQSLTQKVHGLPAKPIGAPTSPLPAPATTSTLASTMAVRERRLNAPSKNVSSSRDRGTGLPPDWEERLPRNGGDNPYFYNVKTHQSTWTRPPFADLGSPSPGKGRDYDGVHGIVDRSPRRGVVDDVARPPLTEVRRRTSPGGSLTFDDRHYRPGASGAVNLQPTLVDKHATQTASPRSFQRLPSPRGSDRRRETRPVTPPPPRRPRSAERPGRTQRAPSLPPADRLPSRRDTGDVRRSPIQDRAWDRTRVTSGRDDMRGQDFTVESTAHRGRRPRDDALPDRMRNNQEPRASSTLSASSLPSSPLAIRTVRRVPSRGGGYSVNDCLEKPREWDRISRTYLFTCPCLPVLDSWPVIVDSVFPLVYFRPSVFLLVLNNILFVLSSRAKVATLTSPRSLTAEALCGAWVFWSRLPAEGTT